ncbi:S1 family peptidase [Nocardia sp. NPDC088792]|uniref:S1 family peptidase n=1 Tax=Nocardia sp. NPDC088792 TaxID=3364332 RepID=UPI0037FBF0ED
MALGTVTRRVALGCCVAVLFTGPTTHPAFAREPAAGELPAELADAVHRDLHIDAHEYLTRTATAQRLAEFASTARMIYPSVFAGVHMDGARPIVSLATGVSADAARTAAGKAGFDVQAVTLSEAALRRRGTAFEHWLTTQPRSTLEAVVGWGMDVERNNFTVRLTKDVPLPKADGPIQPVSMVMPEALPDSKGPSVRAIGVAGPIPDYLGGQPYAIELEGATHHCSFGFNATTADGHSMNITAGHCDPDNLTSADKKSPQPPPIFDSTDTGHGPQIGHFEASDFAPHDYGLLRIEDRVAASFHNNLISANRIAPAPDSRNSSDDPSTGSSGSPRDHAGSPDPQVVAIDGTADPIVGAGICKSGFKSGYTCGTVLAVNQKANLRDVPGHGKEVVQIEGMFFAAVCAQRGDSGGPIIAGTKAVGINSAIVTINTPLDNGCGHLPLLIGQPINPVLHDHPGLTVRTTSGR